MGGPATVLADSSPQGNTPPILAVRGFLHHTFSGLRVRTVRLDGHPLPELSHDISPVIAGSSCVRVSLLLRFSNDGEVDVVFLALRAPHCNPLYLFGDMDPPGPVLPSK